LFVYQKTIPLLFAKSNKISEICSCVNLLHIFLGQCRLLEKDSLFLIILL